MNWLATALFSVSLGESQSLGVIGGADGPTAIFVTTTLRTDYEWILTVAVMIAGLTAWWYLGHLKKK